VIGKFRLPLEWKGAKKVKPRIALLSVVVILVAAIVPTAMAFGTGSQTLPEEKNIGNLIEIINAYFYPGSPSDGNKIPIGQDTSYDDGVPIQDGDYALYFEWRLKDLSGTLSKGDWFDVTIDLGLADIKARIKEQQGAFAPIIYLGDGATAGSIKWVNTSDYDEQQRITLRLALDDSGFEGLVGDGTEENCVKGTGVWGFRYDAGSKAGGNTKIVWQITVGDPSTAGGSTPVIPQPPGNPPEGGNETWNPYDKAEPGYEKAGRRLTPDATPAADTIFYWNIFVNGHKHKTLEEWAACPNNNDVSTVNDDPAPPAGETFTIIDTGTGISPTWLRDVTAADGKAVIDTEAPLLIDKSAGRYGNGLDDRNAPAYLKLFYVNSEYIWQDRIDKDGSGYETPSNDNDPSHKPTPEHPVGAYDPYYSTTWLNEGETSALLYAPNYSGSGEKYYQYLTPVPPSDVKSIVLTDKGFELEVFTDAVFGKTLAIGYMTKAATDSQGAYGQNVSNTIAIKGLEGGSVADSSARVLLGGTVSGNFLTSPNRGKFIIEKLDRNTAQPMENVAFDIVCTSDDKALEQAATAIIEGVKAETQSTLLKTGANGKIMIDLPLLPWNANLTLTITETAPAGFVGVNPFTVTIEPLNGSVIKVAPQAGDKKLVEAEADRYGILVWNKSIANDTSYYDVALRKFVKKVERDGANGPVSVYFNNEPNTDTPGVQNGDRVLFRVDVYNQSLKYTQVSQITDYFSAGLKFDPEATVQNPDNPAVPYTNKNWTLKTGADNVVEYDGDPIILDGRDMGIASGVYDEGRLPLILTVDIPEGSAEGGILTNIAEISEIKDQGGNRVEDIDSTPDADRDNDGLVPDVDYGDTPPVGTVVNNDIEGHRINEDGEPDRSADEDDSDYAQVRLPKAIECAVDKDTIRRTSAAYESLPGEEGWNNVGDELFRYDVDARSTSLLEADAFTIDEPLQNVARDQVRLVALWTPVAWGDIDGKYNIWYQTNKTEDRKVKDFSEDLAWLSNAGYELWMQDLDTTRREQLDIAALGLAEDEYITALRFEYGAVKPGFTTKNTADISQNGEHRNADGTLEDELEDISVLGQTAVSESASKSTNAKSSEPREKRSFGSAILSIFGIGGDEKETTSADASALDAGGGTAISLAELDALAEPAESQEVIDWTPKAGDPFYDDAEIEEIKALTLYPISYLVKAIRPMQDEDITSTAVARIAKKNTESNDWTTDADEDGVITKELVTFTLGADKGAGPATVSSSYVDNIPHLAQTEKPAAAAAAATTGVFRTYDEMKPWLWVGIAAFAGVCLLLLLYRRGLLRNPLPAIASAGRTLTHGRVRDFFPALLNAVKNIPIFHSKTSKAKHRRRSSR
jgi:hypothetical protein